jgi:hypothetical protein
MPNCEPITRISFQEEEKFDEYKISRNTDEAVQFAGYPCTIFQYRKHPSIDFYIRVVTVEPRHMNNLVVIVGIDRRSIELHGE